MIRHEGKVSFELNLTKAAVVGLAVLFAAGGAWAGGPKTPKRGTIAGQVTDPAGMPIEGALVSSGDSSDMTDPGGLYRLDDIRFDRRVSVEFAADGFATTFGVVDLFDLALEDDDSDSDSSSDSDSGSDSDSDSDSDSYSGSDSDSDSGSDSDRNRWRRGRKPKKSKTIEVTLNRVLVPAGAAQTIGAGAGGSVAQDGFVATFPAGALDAPGDVVVVVSPIDVSTPEIGAFPGDFVGVGLSGGNTLLETFSLMDVDLFDAVTGEPVDLAPGAIAALEFLLPATTTLAPGDAIGLWFYDEDAGLWVEEGAGTVGDSTQIPGRLAVFGDVSHFSWWNCDRGIESFNCFSGQVVDSTGAPVPGASVYANGVDYTGTSHDQTDAAGNYCVNVRRDSLVDIRAEYTFGNVALVSQTVQVDTTLPAGTVVSCATGGCTGVADLVFAGLTCISGDVRDDLDEPVVGATVVTNAGPSAVTDASGSFCVAAPGESDVSVVTAGFPTVEVTTDSAGPTCGDPAGCTLAEIRPDATGTDSCLSGTVILGGGVPSAIGDPVPGADVSVFRDEAPFDLLGTAISDGAGEFCVPDLPPFVSVVVVVESVISECIGGDDGFSTGAAGSTCFADDCTEIGEIICDQGGGEA